MSDDRDARNSLARIERLVGAANASLAATRRRIADRTRDRRRERARRKRAVEANRKPAARRIFAWVARLHRDGTAARLRRLQRAIGDDGTMVTVHSGTGRGWVAVRLDRTELKVGQDTGSRYLHITRIRKPRDLRKVALEVVLATDRDITSGAAWRQIVADFRTQARAFTKERQEELRTRASWLDLDLSQLADDLALVGAKNAIGKPHRSRRRIVTPL